MPETLTKLTEKERRFVLAYLGEAAGNGQKAAEMAGYAKGNSAKVTASRLLTKANVAAEIANQRDRFTLTAIADAAERREFLSTVMRSPSEETRDRIKANDLLNKMDGIYVQKHEHAGAGGGPIHHHVRITVVPSQAQLSPGGV